MLKMVRKPSCSRIGITCRMAPWWAGANRKQMPASSNALRCWAGLAAMFTPNASRTSEDPDFEDTARVPCLATFNPPPAPTRATAVEMRSACERRRRPCRTRRHDVVGMIERQREASLRSARAQAVISPTVSPLSRMAVTAAAIWAGLGSPRRQAEKNASASSATRVAPSARRARRGLKASDIGAFRPEPWS